jgi:hypothetical protein
MRRAFFLLLATSLAADDMTLVRGSLAKLAKGGPAAVKEAERNGPVDTLLMRMPSAGTPWRAKYLAAEWLLRAHLLRIQQDPANAGREALEKGWELGWSARSESRDTVMAPSGPLYRGDNAKARLASAEALSNSIQSQKQSTEQVAALDSVVLEIAMRTEDPARMALVAAALAPRKDLSGRDRILAFQAAAHAGRWVEVARWGQELEDGGKVLPAFHDAALTQPEAFDYAALLAWVRLASPPVATALPPSQVFQVSHFRLRLREASGPGSEAVRKAYPEGWQESPAILPPLMRLGAAAHWQRPAARPMPLSGGADATHLDLHGFLDNPSGTRRTERLQASADPARPGWWTGRWSIETRAPDGTILKADFEAELELSPRP